jgi:hypothetical protein
MAGLMLSCFPVVFAQNKKYNPFYYPELSEYADSNRIDFSSEYRKWLMPDSSEKFEDITLELLDSGYVFERSLFNSELFIYEDINGKSLYFKETPFDGVLGEKYARIEMFINPEVELKKNTIIAVPKYEKIEVEKSKRMYVTLREKYILNIYTIYGNGQTTRVVQIIMLWCVTICSKKMRHNMVRDFSKVRMACTAI